jgi:DNA primase catalytic core
MARISKNFIDELSDLPISDLLDAEGIKRLGRGSNQQISCISPNHDDKDPSMGIQVDSGVFHCLGCGCSGCGTLSMYAEMNGLDIRNDFIMIVEAVASRLGKTVEYETKNDPTNDARLQQYKALTEVISEAMKIPYYEDDQEAISKVLREREITKGERNTAKIGMLAKNFSRSPIAKKYESELIAAGVLNQNNETGQIYSKFAGRLVLPITDRKGHVIGMAGRKIKDTDNGPKYLNTNETVAFKKHRVLYGLFTAMDGQKGKVDNIDVVEGYFDVITAQSRGFKETVATMGTAATTDHFKELLRVSRGATFIFDPDKAGKSASYRAMMNGLAFVDRLNIKFAIMPVIDGEKMDPDAFLKKYPANEYQDIKNASINIYELAAEYVVGQKGQNLQQSIQDGMLERGREVYQALPNGMVKSIFAGAIAKEVSNEFSLNLTPEQLGMAIDQQEKIVDLEAEIKEYQKQALMITREVKIEPVPAQSVKMESQITTSPKPIKPQSNNSYSSIKDGGEAAPTPSPSPKIEIVKPEKKEKNEEKAIPFTLKHFRSYKPKKADWVMKPDGEFASVESSYPNGLLEINSISGNKLPDIHSNLCITVIPEKIITSKYDGPQHKSGDKILLIEGSWTGKLPENYYNTVKPLVDNPESIKLDRNIALGLGKMVKATSSKVSVQPEEQTQAQLEEFIGLSEFLEQRPVIAAPEGALKTGIPKKDDYIVELNKDGRVLAVTGVESGSNRIMVRDTNSQSESVVMPDQALILNPTATTISNFNSDIAVQGQPIFKFEKNGPWMGRLPEEWVETESPKLTELSPAIGR